MQPRSYLPLALIAGLLLLLLKPCTAVSSDPPQVRRVWPPAWTTKPAASARIPRCIDTHSRCHSWTRIQAVRICEPGELAGEWR